MFGSITKDSPNMESWDLKIVSVIEVSANIKVLPKLVYFTTRT